MKKILFALACLVALTAVGCTTGMDNTPTKKVEALFNKYQSLDSSVLDDLDTTLAADATLNEDDRKEYRDLMKKHYQDMKYEIKNEKIDGDKATVDVEITVRNYAKAISSSETYKSENGSKFNDKSGKYDATLFSTYRLEELKKVTDTQTYTIPVTLTKQDKEWKVTELSDEDLNKINGLYAG